jgi:Spy/CpxP family protein refolding chaperone
MKRNRIQILLVVVTILALGAGLTAGLLTSRLPRSGSSAPLAPGTGRTPLVEQLGLSAEQRDQMREIWEGVRSQVHNAFEEAQQLQRRRDDALVALLNDEQKAEFEKIASEYANRFDALKRARDEAFADAVQRTKRLLNDAQRQKYEQILKSQVGAAGFGPGSDLGPLPPATAPVR